MGIAQGYSVGSTARNQREELRMTKQNRDQELARLGYSFDEKGNMSVRNDSMAEQEQLAAKEAVQLAKALQGKLSAQDTDRAFEDFSMTGDASYLQRALDNDPNLKQAWGQRGVQLIGNIDFANDGNILSNAGFQPSYYDTDEKKDIIRRNAYKIYNGKDWSIGLAGNAVAETGAARRMGPRRTQPIMDNQKQLVSLLSGPRVSPNTAEGHKYEKQIMAAAEKYNLPPNLIAAQMHAESAGNPKAVSPKGAGGLMQIMPETAKELGVTDVHDPDQSIDGGAKYLRQMMDRYDDNIPLALAAYNAGPGNVDKYGGIPPFGETQGYVKKILGNFDNGEQYYGRTGDDTIKTILEHRRAIANAAQGTTNANVDQKVINEGRAIDAENLKTMAKLKTEGTTSEQKNLDDANARTEELVQTFGGEDKFFETDFSNPKDYNKAFRKVVEIEQLTNTEPSEADKKEMSDLRVIINLSKPIEQLSGSETGIVDKNLGDLNKYLSDEVKGVEAKAAWSAFRNAYLSMLSGKAVTPQEATRQEEAFGKLGNKLGPALQMFEVALGQTQSRLNSLSSGMLPVAAKVRLGADQKKLEAIQTRIDTKLRQLQGLPALNKDGTDSRPPLDSIFKGQ